VTDLRAQLQATLGDAYTLERELGGGGMSRVFVAEERALGRKVVIKVLPAETAAQVSIERFKREIMLAARLQHPHIVPLHSAGESQGLPYFTMPFVEGESLRVRLAKQGELPVSEAIRILREIASALSYAHEHGIVHRDIKPDNVLLSGGSAMVTDFGVAKALSASSNAEHGAATSLGVALGTPAYMAPEQATADPAMDHRADIYAFGVLAYELLTGQPPFVGRTPQNLLAAHVTEAPETISKRRATLPPALAALVMRCLEKRPADRAQTVAEIVHALDDITTPSGGMQPTGAVAAMSGGVMPAPARSNLTRNVGIAAAVFVVVAGAWYAFNRGRTAGAGDATSFKVLAVLPCTNGGDTASDYFAEGISDDLRSELGRVQGITVKARSVATLFKGHADDAGAVASKAGIGLLVTCNVRRAAPSVRVTAELVRVSDNASLWTRKYEGDEKTALALPDSIAHEIAGKLQARLADNHAPGTSGMGTDNQAAYDLYLRGRFLLDKRGNQNIRSAVELFQKATEIDPKFARAYAGLGGALAVLPSWSNTRSDSVIPPALAAIDRAIALDSTLSDALTVRGYALWSLYRWDEAERVLRRAIALNPHDGMAHKYLGTMLAGMGRFEEGVSLTVRASELEPYLPIVWQNLAGVQRIAGQSTAAIASYRHAMELDPAFNAHIEMALALVLDGKTAQAISEIGIVPDSGLYASDRGTRAFVLARAGHRAEAEQIVRNLEREDRSVPAVANALGFAYLGLGDWNQSISWIFRGFAGSDTYAVTGPEFDPLRSHPRWPELLRKMNLQDQPVAKLKAPPK
jgi:serine/threonine-protein kinase